MHKEHIVYNITLFGFMLFVSYLYTNNHNFVLNWVSALAGYKEMRDRICFPPFSFFYHLPTTQCKVNPTNWFVAPFNANEMAVT